MRHLGALAAFHLDHGGTLESLCNEFEDRDPDFGQKVHEVNHECRDKFYGHQEVREKVGAFGSGSINTDFNNKKLNQNSVKNDIKSNKMDLKKT